MSWYLAVLKQYAVFDGRAHRTEYWMFFVVNLVVSFALGFVDGMAGWTTTSGYGLLSGLYSLAVLLPAIGVGIRRLHDTGRSGFWLLIGLIPCVGFIVLIVFFAMEGTRGSNPYGEDPKG